MAASNPTDREKFSRRLTEARDNARLTQEEVAAALRVPRTAIVKMEAGERAVSSDELVKLADLYRRPLGAFFESRARTVDSDPLVVLGRMAPELEGDPETKRAIDRIVDICHHGLDLEARLGRERRSGPPVSARPAPRNIGDAIRQGEQAAEGERRRLGLGHASLADVHELIGAQGVWAANDHLPDRVSGLFISHPSTGLVVVVNRGHARSRQRFSYAHEYAHALFDRDLTVTCTTADGANELREQRANAFAASLLMPEQGVHLALASMRKGQPTKEVRITYDPAGDDTTEAELRSSSQQVGVMEAALLAILYDVSYPAACYRLRNLAYVNAEGLKSLLKHESAGKSFIRLATMPMGAPESPPDESENRDGQHIVAQVLPLIVEAYEREEITRGKVLELARLLGIPGPEVLELAAPR